MSMVVKRINENVQLLFISLKLVNISAFGKQHIQADKHIHVSQKITL